MSNVQLVKNVYEAFGRGDVPGVLAGFAPNIEWRESEGYPYQPATGDAFIGGEDITQNLFMKLGTEWDGYTVTPKTFHDAGDTIVVEGRYAGTFKETGKSVDAELCHVWKVRDGKIMSFQQYTDGAQFQDVMGAR
jgi:ketosteroid isomerase-like protein